MGTAVLCFCVRVCLASWFCIARPVNRKISRHSNVGGEGVRPQDHAGVSAVRVRLRYPPGAGAELRLRRERLELCEEQQKVRRDKSRLTAPDRILPYALPYHPVPSMLHNTIPYHTMPYPTIKNSTV